MKNLNDAYDEVIEQGEAEYILSDSVLSIDELKRKHDYYVDLVDTIVSNVVSKRIFDKLLAVFCTDNSELLADERCHLVIKDIEDGEFNFIVRYNGSKEEIVVAENRNHLNRVCGNMDWFLLQRFKITTIEDLGIDEEDVELAEVVSLIQKLQDFAVDKAGLDEQVVFPGLGKEEEGFLFDETQNYTLIDEDGNVMGFVKAGPDMAQRISTAIQAALNNPDEFDITEFKGEIITVEYLEEDEIGLAELEISLVPTSIY